MLIKFDDIRRYIAYEYLFLTSISTYRISFKLQFSYTEAQYNL